MKILMLGWELFPHHSGGLGVVCYQLCRSLAKFGADIDFVLPYTADHNIDFMRVLSSSPQSIDDLRKAGIAYDSYKYVKETGQVEWLDMNGQSTMFEDAVGRIATHEAYEVIHAHDWMTFRAALRAKELANLPLVVHIHSIESDRAGGGYGNPLVREIEQTAMLLADRVVAISEHSKQSIVREYQIPADKIEVAYNSIDIAEAEKLDSENCYKYLTEMQQHGYRVLSNVGRLTMQKGLPNFLRVVKEVVAYEPKTLFLIVGSGDQERELIELGAELGISRNVIFAGFQRGKKWRDAFAVGDLFVLPSVSEPFGITPLEAAGYGTPSLISRQSGVAEVLRNCLKVDFWDIKEMANQIVSLVRHDSLRDEIHKNAFAEYNRLTWDETANRLLAIYSRHLQAGAA